MTIADILRTITENARSIITQSFLFNHGGIVEVVVTMKDGSQHHLFR